MGHLLHDWCLEKRQLHPDLNLDCEKFGSTDIPEEVNELQEMVTTGINKKLEQEPEIIENEIAVKRRQVEDLKNLIETKNYETHERRNQMLKKISKDYYQKMVAMIILLVTAIIIGIILIYYFFIYRKK